MKKFKICVRHVKVLTLISLVVMQSCSKKEETSDPGFVVSATYSILLVDSSGSNLLDPKVPNAYDESEIRLYELDEEGNERLLMSGENLVRKPESGPYEYIIGIITLGHKQADNTYLAYLQLGQDIDTLRLQIFEDVRGIFKKRIWYNGRLVWDVEKKKTLPVRIVK